MSSADAHPVGRRRVAAFDVDGTLTTSDCVTAFLRRTAGLPRLGRGLLTRPVPVVRAAWRRDRDELKAMAARVAFAGARTDDLAREGRTFAAEVAATGLRSDTLERLRTHQRDGDLVVFVSASFEIYLHPLAELLGVDAVLGTRLRSHDGVYDGALDGPNCRGPEKVVRLHELLDRLAGGRAGCDVVAYGDSAGDRQLLDDADEGHWMGRYRP